MAHTKVTKTHSQNTGVANTFSYSGSFDVFKGTEVVVLLDGIALTFTASTINESASPREYTVDPSAKTVHIGGADLAQVGGVDRVITIRPETDLGSPTPRATYQPGSSVTSDDLNNNQLQLMRKAMEYDETKMSTTGSSVMTGDLQLGQNVNIKFEGSADDEHETTLTAANPTSDKTITLPDTTGTVVTTGDTGTVATAMIAADAVNGTKIADDSINSEHYVDGSIDTAHIADSQITSAKIANGTIVADDLASDAVTTVKITDSNVTTAKIADANVTTAKIADDAITTAKINNNAVTSTELAVNSVTNSRINADAVTNAKIADDSIDSEHYVDGSIDTAHIGGAQVTDAKLASNSVTESKILDSAVTSAKISAGNVTLLKLHSDLRSTSISNSDVQLPTSGAVVDYVAAQIAPIGGLEVIADEDNFPTSQPGSGVVISISDAAGIVVNGSGVSTTARTAGNGSDNVTINNFPSSLYGETLASGVGLMVSSTGSSNIYNYHKLLAAETDVKQLSDDINDFNARYRVNAGEPGSNNDEGDLVFDTNANKMKVYDGSSWGEVTSSGDFKYLFLCPAGGTGAPTLNGSIATYDLRESSNSGSAASVTSAAQLIVSINGVVQKANTGTSAPSEGFALVDSNTIVFGANLQTGDSVFIIQIGSAVTIPTPGDGTVAAAKIADDAVTAAKIGSLTGNINFADNAKAALGAGDDLQLFHDGTYSRINSENHGLIIRTDVFHINNGANNESLFRATTNNAIELYYDNVKRLETTSTGATVTGSVVADNTPGRNLVINGAMQVAQRGTSSTSTGYQTVDRFELIASGTDETPTQAQVDVASGTTPYTLGFRKALKLTNGNQTSVGATDTIKTQYKFEAQDLAKSGWNYTSTSSDITLSFWIKSSVAQSFKFSFITWDGSAKMYPMDTGSLSADTWTKITKTIPGASGLSIDNDNAAGAQINFFQYLGTDYTNNSVTENAWTSYGNPQTKVQTTTWYTTNDATFELTGVQLEVGSVATNFEHRSYTQELALCQRYCEVLLEGEGDGAYMVNSVGYYTNQLYAIARFAVEKRASPTLVQTTGTNYYINYRDNTGINFDSFNGLSWPNKRATGLYATSTVTSGHAGLLGSSNSGAKVYVTAEI